MRVLVKIKEEMVRGKINVRITLEFQGNSDSFCPQKLSESTLFGTYFWSAVFSQTAEEEERTRNFSFQFLKEAREFEEKECEAIRAAFQTQLENLPVLRDLEKEYTF